MSDTLTARVAGIYVGFDSDSLVKAQVPEIEVTWEGFRGDRHAGITRKAEGRDPRDIRGREIRNNRQWSAVSEAELHLIGQSLGVLPVLPEWLGANLCITGVSGITDWPATTELRFPSGAILTVYGENLPCTGPGKVIQRMYPEVPGLIEKFPKSALHLRGLVGWVDRIGTVRQNDEIEVRLPKRTG